MKPACRTITILLLVCIAPVLQAQSIAPVPFSVGEEIQFSVWYNFVRGGYHTLKVSGLDTVGGYACYQLQSRTETSRFFSRFYKVRDVASSWLDVHRLVPHRFEKDINEGHYSKEYRVLFHYEDSLAVSNTDTVRIDQAIQDPLSIFYALRAESWSVGQRLKLLSFDEDKMRDYDLLVKGRETLKTPLGDLACLVLEPFREDGELFRNQGRVTIWLSDDQRRIPVKVVGKTTIGSMIFQLESYQPGNSAQE